MKTPKTPVQAEKKLNTPKSGGISKRKSNGVGDIKPFPGLAKAFKEAAQESKQSPFKKPTPLKGSPKVENGKASTPKAQKQSPAKPGSGKKTPKRKFEEVSISAKTPDSKAVPHVATPYPKSLKKESNDGAKDVKPKIKKNKKDFKEEFQALKKAQEQNFKKSKKKKLAKSLQRRSKMQEYAASFGDPVPKDQLLKKPTALKAVQALKKLVDKEGGKGKGTSILPKEDKQLLAQINVMKPCPVGERSLRLHLSHPIVREGASICLLTSDHKDKEDYFKKLLKDAGVTNIKDVITFKTLRNEYKQYESKKKLIMLHDLFLVEGKISHRIVPFLGKFSVLSHKIPTPVMLKNKNIKKAIDSALERTSISIRKTSTSFCCQIGMLGQSDGVVSDNLVALSDAINSSVPGGWKNVSSLHLRCDALSVPVYVSLASPNEVTIPEPKEKPKKGQEVVEDELSTIPGARVKVHPDGKVDVKMNKEEADSDEDDEDFEFEEGDDSDESDDDDLVEEEEEDVGSAEDDLSGDDSDEETPTKKLKTELKVEPEESEDDDDEENLGKLEESYLKGMDEGEKPGKKGKFSKGPQQGRQPAKPQGKNLQGSFKQNQKQKGKNQKGSPKSQGFTQKASPKQNNQKKGGFFKGGKKGKK